jgi:hypothetical protein
MMIGMRKVAPIAWVIVTAVATTAAQDVTTAVVWRGEVRKRLVEIVAQWISAPNDSGYRVRVGGNSGKVVEIDLAGVGTLQPVRVWADRRLVVTVGTITAVIDVPGSETVDEFYCARPAVSPEARFIACLRFVPRWATDEDVVVIYDVSGAPASNRTRLGGNDQQPRQDAGIPVFPQWNRDTGRYTGRLREPGQGPVQLHSPLQWIDTNRFAFVAMSASGGKAQLAVFVADARAGAAGVRVQSREIDAPTLIDVRPYQPQVAAAELLYVRSIEVRSCERGPCQIRLHFFDAAGLRASYYDLQV